MDTEAVGHSSLLEFPEENDILADFLHGYMEIPDPRIDVLQVIELMVMCGEEGLRPMAVFMDIFDYGSGYRHAVVCRCSSSYLIQKDK